MISTSQRDAAIRRYKRLVTAEGIALSREADALVDPEHPNIRKAQEAITKLLGLDAELSAIEFVLEQRALESGDEWAERILHDYKDFRMQRAVRVAALKESRGLLI